MLYIVYTTIYIKIFGILQLNVDTYALYNVHIINVIFLKENITLIILGRLTQ